MPGSHGFGLLQPPRQKRPAGHLLQLQSLKYSPGAQTEQAVDGETVGEAEDGIAVGTAVGEAEDGMSVGTAVGEAEDGMSVGTAVAASDICIPKASNNISVIYIF